MLFDAVRTNIVAEAVTFAHVVLQVEREGIFLTGAIEIMQCAEPVNSSHLDTTGTECGQMLGKLSAGPGEIRTGILDVLLGDSDRNILFLRNAVGVHRLIQKHLVVLPAVVVKTVAFERHENRLLEIRLLHAVVIDGDLCGSAAVKGIKQFRIGQEHAFLILAACHKIVDVGKLPALDELAANLKDPVSPDPFDGDYILDFLRDPVLFLIRTLDSFDGFNHASSKPPFHDLR